jgi:hypothetical protein
MKRILSILLMSLMLVVAIRPMMLTHFCMDSLVSVKVGIGSEDASCCCKHAQDGIHKKCCTLQKVTLSTDDYNYQPLQIDWHKVVPSFELLLPVLNEWCSTYLYVDKDSQSSHAFPPGGLNKLNLNLLTYICVFRI